MKNYNFLENGKSNLHITSLVRKTVYEDDGVNTKKKTTEEYIEQNITSDYIFESKKQYGFQGDAPDSWDVEPIKRNEKLVNSKEKSCNRSEEQDIELHDEVSRAMTCRQQTMLFVFLFEKMGIDVKSANRTELAKLIHKFTGRCLKNVYDNFNIDYENRTHVKNLMVVAKAIENVFPDIATIIENSCKPIE